MQLERWAGAIVVEFKLWIMKCRPLFNLTMCLPSMPTYQRVSNVPDSRAC